MGDDVAEEVAPPARKHGAVGRSGHEESKAMHELSANVAKLSLSSALQARVVRSITTQFYRIPADSVWIVAHLKATKAYVENITKLRETLTNEQAKTRSVCLLPMGSTHWRRPTSRPRMAS